MTVCPSCGHENEAGAKFCSQCATPLAEPRAGGTERKVVTVLFADRPEAGEGMAAGDVVNTAARLQSAAPVNGILAGEATYRATAETIEYREHADVEAKGKEAPIPVWEVAQARGRFGV